VRPSPRLPRGLLAVALAMLATAADGAAPSIPLTGKQIRQKLVGKVITDSAHWNYYLKPNGTIDALEHSLRRKGSWRLKGDRLCIAIVAGAAPDECWDVAQEGKNFTFASQGHVVYVVKAKPPPL
jgi:hypothetical protein